MISGYCGTGDALPDAIGKFSLAYLEQTERDYSALEAAARRGRISVAGQA
jgi:argininosuccinate lyase